MRHLIKDLDPHGRTRTDEDVVVPLVLHKICLVPAVRMKEQSGDLAVCHIKSAEKLPIKIFTSLICQEVRKTVHPRPG